MNRLKELPPGYRETLHLFYQEGYSTDEIARLLGVQKAAICK